ncbi:MAG: hypothetical protein KZQ83_18400 [gamma proteobacterium symbiont of Taylorina sp.]|nr:hypothetical protein [gamma proteobacterium symbiont of Taylorina sp.]
MKKINVILTAATLTLSSFTFAYEEITAQAAYEAVTNSDAHILDVRTGAEFIWVGHPDVTNITNISLKIDTNNKMTSNSNFITDVDKIFGDDKTTQIITICRSGTRGAAAATALEENGYTNVYTVTDGFEGGSKDSYGNRNINGWKNSNLPVKVSSVGASDVYNNISNSATLSESLEIHIPFVSYPDAHTNAINLSVDLEFSHSENETMYWKLKQYSINE